VQYAQPGVVYTTQLAVLPPRRRGAGCVTELAEANVAKANEMTSLRIIATQVPKSTIDASRGDHQPQSGVSSVSHESRRNKKGHRC